MSKIINIKPSINPDGYFQDNIDISELTSLVQNNPADIKLEKIKK